MPLEYSGGLLSNEMQSIEDDIDHRGASQKY
jgi:hypothetical protein